MKIISVIPLKKGLLKGDLTYFSTKEILPGNIVRVLLRNKETLGLVTSSENVADLKGKIKGLDFDLKKIIEVKGKSVFREAFFEAAILTSEYFISNKGNTLTSLVPASFRENYDKISKIFPVLEKENFEKNKIKNEKLLFQASFEERISYYKTLIRESFAKKESIYLVLPTEYEVTNFSEILSKGIENFIISLHGGISAKKQIELYEKIATNDHPLLIVGTAPFLIIPRTDLKTIILEKESSNAYKSLNGTKIDLRILAEIFATKIGAKFISSDTILRFETIARKNKDDFGEVCPISFRTNFNGTIEIISKNPKTETEKESKFKILADTTIAEIKKHIELKENVFIFSLRKGLATLTICKDCNEPVLCNTCLAPVVLYLSRDNTKRMFVCNKCKSEKDPKMTCEHCGGWNLTALGIGTDTVYEEIKKQILENKIFKLDKEEAKTAKQAEKIITDFLSEANPKNKGNVLIGTEMALFYLKEKIPLSVIASFDSLWSIPNFKMSEKIIQIISSMISKTEKKIIIETKNEKDPAITAFKNENLLSFVREELKDRENLGYPPYKRFIKITFLGNKEETLNAKRVLTEMLADYNPEIFSGFIAMQKNKYITNALIKIDPKKWSCPEISPDSTITKDLQEKLFFLQPNFTINIDPEDLL